MKPAIEPVVWSPPPAPANDAARARLLRDLVTLQLPSCGEDVAIDAEGRLISGLEDGSVVRVHPETQEVETLANTGGRPAGIEVDSDGSLVVCDAPRGLFRIQPDTREVSLLVDAKQHGLTFCNNAAIARDGTIYFSDSSRRFGIAHWRAEIFEHSGTGRLFARHPDGRVEVLLDGLEFANGVALAADESFVAVAETGAYRVTRYWLSGEKRGSSDLLIDGLPGFPDNLSSDDEGNIWVALPSTRNALLDVLHRHHPRFRKLVWALPEFVQPKPERLVSALAVNGEGKVVTRLLGRSPLFHMVTGVRAKGDRLYLASLEHHKLAVVPRPR